MKLSKIFSLIAPIAIVVLIANCSQDDEFEFGSTISDFQTDSVYKTSSDGLLFVETISFGSPYATGQVTAKVYADQTSDPTTEIGIVHYSITLPLEKDIYWKVTRLTSGGSFRITWTPIQK